MGIIAGSIVSHEFLNLPNSKKEYVVIRKLDGKFECAELVDKDAMRIDTTYLFKVYGHDLNMVKSAEFYGSKYIVVIEDFESGSGCMVSGSLYEATNLWKVFGIVKVYKATDEQIDLINSLATSLWPQWARDNLIYVCQY